MAATTYTWNVITTGQTDGDSPLDETLMDALRENQISLEEWMGDGFAQAKDHDHDGANSKTVVLGNDSVEITKLNTGMVQSVITADEISGASGTGVYAEIYDFSVYIPTGATTLIGRGDFYDSANTDSQVRLDSPTASTSTQQLTTSYTTYVLPTLDVSSDSGWIKIKVMGRGSGGTLVQYSRAFSYMLG